MCASVALTLVLAIALQSCRSESVAKGNDEQQTTKSPGTDDGSVECPSSFPHKRIRLPDSLRPELYELFIHPNLTTFTFTGHVKIQAKIAKDTNLLVFNSKNLTIDSYNVSVEGSAIIPQVGLEECKKLEQIALKLKRTVVSGKNVIVNIKFAGNITDSFAGLYRSSLKGTDGKLSYSAVTQFEATDARSLFPCLDEPAFKAKFKLSLVREKRHVALSNMPLKATRPFGSAHDVVLDEFNATLKMSTYLLAMAVGDFKNISRNTSSNIKVSVFAPDEQIRDAEFPLGVAVKALQFFQNYFNVSFPLPKQDLLAVSDFSSGAMENWGLITFRDQMLLWNEQSCSSSQKEVSATVVVHELAHQWFGNLVTMKWWNDLWLNEGFATLMEYFATSRIFPNWKPMERFYLDNVAKGLYRDGCTSSHPVSSEVDDPADIGSIFDAISYQKGASLINMFMDISGVQSFSEGLTDYFKKYQYSNAEGEDLWRTLGKRVSTLDGMVLTEVAKAWTTQVGYPLISVELFKDKKKVLVNQSRFLYLKKERLALNTSESLWPVPLTYRTNRDSTVKRVWIKNLPTTEIDLEEPVDWIAFNSNGTGFYRILYTPSMYTALIDALKKDASTLSPGDRSVLVCDSFSLSKAGLVSMETVMHLFSYAEEGRETELLPLSMMFTYLTSMNSLVWQTDFFNHLRAYQRWLIEPLYEKFGWQKQEDHTNKLLQREILGIACKVELPDCLKIAREKFDACINTDNCTIIPDHAHVVYSNGIRFGNRSEWDKVYKKYTKSTLPSEQAIYLDALTYSRDPWQLYQYLLMTLDMHKVKPNFMDKVLSGVASNSVAGYMAWRFLRTKWDDIVKRVGKTSMLGNAISAVTDGFSTQFDYDEVKSFLDGKDLGKNKRKYQQALETIAIRIQWRQENEAVLRRWLKSRHNLVP